MPYREGGEESPCHQCERPTTRVCKCCNRPTCTKHLEVTMCSACDEALYAHMKRHDGANGMFLGLLASVVLLCLGAWASTPLIFVGMAGLIAGPFVGLGIYKRRVRVRFLRKVRETGALPAPASESNPDLRRLDAYLAKRTRDRVE